jgi:hypothetical protein
MKYSCPEAIVWQTDMATEKWCKEVFTTKFYVFLTVHLGVILVNDQLDAQFFFLICLFQSSTRFEQLRAHHQEN